MLELAVKSLLAYLLGSLMGALLIGGLRGVDIRTLGSGNAGGTNALRTQGLPFALGVVVIDVAKGWLATSVLPAAALPGIPIDGALAREWLAVSCGVSVVVGHVYPVWWEFRGGKGAATLVGVLAGLAPGLLLPVLGTWLLIVMLTGFVGLATMIAVANAAVLVSMIQPLRPALLAFCLSMTAFVVYTHRGNIARMRCGTEARARRLWLLRDRGGAGR
jgi:acyl phosphate:glycerol-3-phosphate acyltransferase